MSATAASPEPASPKSWLWLALLVLATISASLSLYCVDGLVDPVRRSQGFSDLQMSFILGWAYVGVFALASLPAGWLVDHGSRRRILLAGALLWGSGAVVSALAHAYGPFCLGRGMAGLGRAAMTPAAMSILADSFPTRLRARVFGVLLAADGMGPGVGLTAAGSLLGLFSRAGGGAHTAEAWRAAMLCCAAPAFLVAGLLLFMPEPPRQTAPEPAAIAYGGARFWPPLAVTLLAIGAVFLSDGAQLSWSAAALVREHAVAPADAARYAGYVFIFCGAAAPLAAGTLADLLYKRHGIPGRLVVALAAVALLIPLQCFYGVKTAAEMLTVLLGTGFTVVTGEVVGAAVLQDIAPDHRRGLAAAANSLCAAMAIGLGTTGVAVTARWRATSPHPILEAMSWVTVPASTLSLLVFFALWMTVSRSRRTQPA
ncbi:MAG: MFS transporter [Caulobacteraceae bacterium]|nr:MFS transporter [Caulobacteraceae bacterium]